MTFSFFVVGKPIAQPRHRATSIGGFARMYLPAKHPVNAWKQAVALVAQRFIQSPLNGPLAVSLTFWMPRAKWLKRKPNPVAAHCSKPDCDNLAKAVLDALNGVAWNDDSQVHSLRIAKWTCHDDQKVPGCEIAFHGETK